MDANSLFSKAISENQIATDDTSLEAYASDWCPKFRNKPQAVLLPKTSEEVASIIKIANQNKLPIIPVGGRTGLSGGATPSENSVVISLEKLNKVLDINPTQRTLVTEAGAITAKVHQAAEEQDLYFPVHFASQGSSMIGGNAGTNVGGIHVVRYGGFRDWVLGLKVVTGKGDLLDINADLYKNQTGYDLKNLFIGSEGTLGIITELTLKLTAKPLSHTRIIGAIKEPAKTLELLKAIRSTSQVLSAIEYFDRKGLEKVLEKQNLKEPLQDVYDHYVLIEIEDTTNGENSALEELLMSFLESELLLDAVISQNSQQAEDLLALRERIGEVLASEHKAHKNDLAVAVKNIPTFLEKLNTLLEKEYKDYEYSVFGHIGDGNLHLNILKPKDEDDKEFREKCSKVDKVVFTLVSELGGSISAEHGIGLLKKDYLHFSRSEEEVAYMKDIKKIFDPNGILNPGKIF